LRALATSGSRRATVLPEVPTVAESGLAGYEASLWLALVAPAGTPPAIVARLNREVNEVLASADGKEALAAQGVEAEPGPPEAVTERIRGDTAKWRGVVAKTGIKAQ
jgi:tripartite-type tricarboxylate transporter receptor subunit TctC